MSTATDPPRAAGSTDTADRGRVGRPPAGPVGTWTLTPQGIATVTRLELRQRVRSTRWIVSLVVFGLLVGGVSVLIWAFVREIDPSQAAVGPSMFGFIVFFVLFLGLLVSPTLSATAINGDRAAGTLATLQVTLLSAAEIAVGKLLAAWLASLAFLAVSLPFVLWAFATGGTLIWAVLVTLVLLAVLLAVVCAIALGFSALSARPAGSAVLSYVTVAGLSILSVILFGLSVPLVSGEETVQVHGVNWERVEEPLTMPGEGFTEDEWVEPPCETYTTTRWVGHTERTWWLLAINPFVIVADAAPGAPASRESVGSIDPLSGIRAGVRAARQGPEEPIQECWNAMDDESFPPDAADMSPVWPWGLAANLLLGAAGVALAVRRLQIPQRTLPKGTRVA